MKFGLNSRVVVTPSWPVVGGLIGTVVRLGSTPFQAPDPVYRVRIDQGFPLDTSPSVQSRRPMRLGPYDEALMDTRWMDTQSMDFLEHELSALDAVSWLGEQA